MFDYYASVKVAFFHPCKMQFCTNPKAYVPSDRPLPIYRQSIWSLLISECLAWELIHLPLKTNFTKENNFHRRNDFQMGWSETPVDLKKKRIDHELIAYDWNLFHRVIAFSIIFSPLMYTHDQYCTWMWNLPSVQHLVFGADFNQLSYEVTQVWTQGQVINADRT